MVWGRDSNLEKAVETFARFGYAAIGILALMTAFNIDGGKITGATGALKSISQQPLGKILLLFIAVNLIGYALWKLIQAFKDPRNQRSGFSGLVNRLSCIIAAVGYSGIAIKAGLLVFGSQESSSGKSESAWTASIMQQPLGRWSIGLAGASIIGFGFWQMYIAYKAKFRKNINFKEVDHQQKKWLIDISRYGIATRGLVFAAFGLFILKAAHQYDPKEVKGFDEVLFTFAKQPFGKVFLALIAAGLIAYGLYLFVLAFYRRIKVS